MNRDTELYARFNQARTMAESGLYSEALAEFLYFIENQNSLGSFGRANLQYILSEIIDLANHLPEAIETLVLIRNNWEELILAGDGGWSYLHNVHIINERLGQPERDLVLLDQLANLGPEFKQLHQKFLIVAWEQLARAGRYADLTECIDTRVQDVAGALTRYQVQWEFAEDEEQREDAVNMLRYFLPSALLAYKTLLVLDKDEFAAKLAKWVFECEPLTEAPSLFVSVANKLGRADIAASLTQTRQSLPGAGISGNTGAVSPVPNSGETSQDFEGETP
ncbi:MAG: hypothetical protein JWQ02_1939 [Capsulimonas sp.]|jgi:hypothetical protein|nr:hypothetical protein [Capsulimonas sp.]